MHITLTTAYNPGDADVGHTYPHVYIPRMSDAPTGNNLSFDYEYGTATVVTTSVPGAGLLGATANVSTISWVKGTGSPTRTATISGNPYLVLISANPIVSTDSSYNTLIRALYTYLIGTIGIAGSITNP